MKAKIIDGKAVAQRITDEASAVLGRIGVVPGIAVVLVGDDAASHLYVRLKEKACRDIGIAFEKLLFRENADETAVIRSVATLNAREDVDAILVQLPLPAHLDENRVIDAIDPAKDVDGFHPENVRLLRAGATRIVPGLAAGILELIRSTNERLAGKTALVVANSETFYAPLEAVLSTGGMTPSFAKPDDASLAEKTRAADVLVVAIGRPGFFTGAMLKPGAIVIDVGTNRIDGRTVGDVDPVSAGEVAGHLTPVPGGVGPVTVAMLLRNAVELCLLRRGPKNA